MGLLERVVEMLGTGEAVEAHAVALSQLVEALQFDSAHVREIAAFGEVP